MGEHNGPCFRRYSFRQSFNVDVVSGRIDIDKHRNTFILYDQRHGCRETSRNSQYLTAGFNPIALALRSQTCEGKQICSGARHRHAGVTRSKFACQSLFESSGKPPRNQPHIKRGIYQACQVILLDDLARWGYTRFPRDKGSLNTVPVIRPCGIENGRPVILRLCLNKVRFRDRHVFVHAVAGVWAITVVTAPKLEKRSASLY